MSRFIKSCFYLFNLSSITAVSLLVMVLAYTSQGAAEKSQLADIYKKTMVKHPNFSRAEDASYFFKFDGFLNKYLRAISENWLKVAPDRNPAILEMFADREKNRLVFYCPGRAN